MNPKDIFYELLKAEDEAEVDLVLEHEGYLVDDESIWKSLGGFENNSPIVGNQHAHPTGALVDKMINGIDAVLMAQCFSSGIDPESYGAPQTMSEAVEQFFNLPGGRLDSIDATQRTKLAELFDLRVIAVGNKEAPSYLLTDKGEGQTPQMFPKTFLSLNQSNKLRIPFVQGRFNSGGTGVLQFCGTKNYQLIASKRNPVAPNDPGDNTCGLWGFTLVRRLRPAKGRKSSMYVYLAPQGSVLTFAAPGIDVLPGNHVPNQPPKPYRRPLEYGTCVKLYNYRWRARSVATTDARFEIERYLHGPSLPFRVTETRDDYKANTYSATISGVWAGVGSSSNKSARTRVEPNFPASSQMDIESVGRLPYRIVVFDESVDTRHVPHGVFFTMNGQVHGDLQRDFVGRRLKFDYLNRYLLVSVDCTQMDDSVREDFFMASRDRIRQNETYHNVVTQLEDELRDHPGLKALNAARRKNRIEKALASEQNSADAFRHLLRSDPSLAGLFDAGFQLVTSTGSEAPRPFKGKRFPTFFRLTKEPKQGLTKFCPINRTIRVEFETDAENDYFDRHDSPGSITFDPPGILQHQRLWNGRFSATFHPLTDAKVGDTLTVGVVVRDVENEIHGGPFICEFGMVVDKSLERPKRHKKPSDPTKPSPGPGEYENNKLNLSVPNIVEVNKDQWNTMQPSFTSFDSLRVRSDGNGGYDFYLNVDNSFLLTELSRNGNVEKQLMKYWFKYGLVLCGLGMLQQYLSTDSDGGLGEEGEEHSPGSQDPIDLVNGAMAGLARVIIPVVRSLYKGPS